MKIATLVKGLKSKNCLAQVLCSLFKGKDFVWLCCLKVHKISSIAVLKDHIKVVLIFSKLMKLYNMLVVHVLHACNFSLQIFNQMFILSNHFLLVNDLKGELLLLGFHKKDITEGSLSKFTFADILA